MSEARFTPGPWVLHPDSQEFVREAASDAIIADIRDGDHIDPNVEIFDAGTRKANAHLIAAAPDLYAAAKNLFDYVRAVDLPNVPSVLGDQVRAAIAKAEGRKEVLAAHAVWRAFAASLGYRLYGANGEEMAVLARPNHTLWEVERSDRLAIEASRRARYPHAEELAMTLKEAREFISSIRTTRGDICLDRDRLVAKIEVIEAKQAKAEGRE